MSKNKTVKKGFQLDGDRKPAKKAADAAESPQARGARTRRARAGKAGAGQGKSLTKPILGSVRVMKTQGGGVNIIVTPFTL